MAAMTYADIPQIVPDAGRRSYTKDATKTLFPGSLVGLLAGLLVPWADTGGIIFLGFMLADEPALGNFETETGIAQGYVQQAGDSLNHVAVAGATSVADVGAKVYCGTDNWRTDLTLTPTANAGAIGHIDRFNPDGSFSVALLTPKEYLIQA